MLIDLRNLVNRERIPENENPNKVIDIVDKINNSDKQQKGKGTSTLTPKKCITDHQ